MQNVRPPRSGKRNCSFCPFVAAQIKFIAKIAHTIRTVNCGPVSFSYAYRSAINFRAKRSYVYNNNRLVRTKKCLKRPPGLLFRNPRLICLSNTNTISCQLKGEYLLLAVIYCRNGKNRKGLIIFLEPLKVASRKFKTFEAFLCKQTTPQEITSSDIYQSRVDAGYPEGGGSLPLGIFPKLTFWVKTD